MRHPQHGRRLSALLIALVASAGASAAASGVEPDSARAGSSSLVALPYAYYTPETKIAFGAGSIYSFRPAGGSAAARPSDIRLALTYTQLNQMIIGLMPNIYIKNEDYYFGGYYGFYKFPTKFWGVGNETPDDAEESYERRDFESETNALRRVGRGVYVGVRYQFQRLGLKKIESDGILRDGATTGSEGGFASGLGIIVRHDTRDNVYQPSTGFYNQCHAVFFGGASGSDYSFAVLSVDLRKYFSVFGSHVVALQTYDTFIDGEPPFQMMSLLGGSYCMRGYYLGRYRDRNMITAQVEYRAPLAWRLGAVAFAGFGDVSDRAADFRLDQFKYSVGFGLRFMFDTRERINARLDAGFGKDGNAGVYAMVLEAF